MVGFAQRVAAASAVIAAVVCSNTINGQRPPRLPSYCRGTSGDPNQKDRYCEVDGPKPASRCGCQQVCHIWGDPHVEPFFSGCSAVTLKDGDYSMLTLPNQLRIEANVENYYVRRLYIAEGSNKNDVELWFDSVTDCRDATSFKTAQYPVYTDTGAEANIIITTHCEKPPSRSVWHLNTTIVLDDECHGNGDGNGDGNGNGNGNQGAADADAPCQYKNKNFCLRNGCVWNPRQSFCQTAEDFAEEHEQDSCKDGAQQPGESRHNCKRKEDGCGYDKEQNICYALPGTGNFGPSDNDNDDNDGGASFGNIPPSAARTSFASAFGACMNPCNRISMARDGSPIETVDETGREECRDRGNSRIWFWQRTYGTGVCPQLEAAWDGLKASCNSECSAFGDPYVTDFFTDMPNTRGCKVGKNCFNVYPDETEESQEMYGIEGVFQGLIETDECQYITKFIARYFQENGDYYQTEYSADEYCGTEFDGLISPSSRTILSVPQYVPEGVDVLGMSSIKVQNLAVDRQVFDSSVNGFNLRTAEAPGFGTINVGGVRIILKCHNTKDKKQFPTKAYWNVCVHRDAVEPQANAVDAAASGTLSLQNIETALKTRGHCALGEYDYRKGTYAHRSPDDIAPSVASSSASVLSVNIPKDFQNVGVAAPPGDE